MEEACFVFHTNGLVILLEIHLFILLQNHILLDKVEKIIDIFELLGCG